MVAMPLHARLKMIAGSRGERLENMVSEVLWNFAKRTPMQIPKGPDGQ